MESEFAELPTNAINSQHFLAGLIDFTAGSLGKKFKK